MDTAVPASSRADTLSAWYAVIVLVVATVFGALDRQILILLAEPMRLSLGLSDTRLGILQGLGITLFGGAAAMPVAWLADRFGRRRVLASSVLVWGAATACCGLAQSFGLLYASSVGLGIGEAAIVPVIYALIPEVVPARQRVLANGIYATAAIFGAGLGVLLSSYLAHGIDSLRPFLPAWLQTLEAWRLSFLVVAVPAPAVALLVLLIRLHPQRERVEEPEAVGRSSFWQFLLANARVLIGIYVGVALATFGLAAATHWLPVVAARQFHRQAFDVGRGFGAAYLAGTVFGAPLGGAIVRWLRPRLGVSTTLRVVSVALSVTGMAALLSPWMSAAGMLYVLFGVEVACVIAASVVLPTLLQDMVPVSLRSRGIALCMLITSILSSASPVLVGMLSDAMPLRHDALLLSVSIVQVTSMIVAVVLLCWMEPAHRRLVQSLYPHLAQVRP